MGGVKKKIQKIIPKEIRPAAPFIAAAMMPVGGYSFLSGLSPTAQLAVSRGLTAAATSALTDPEAKFKDSLRAGVIAGASPVITKGLGSFAEAKNMPKFLQGAQKFLTAENKEGISRLTRIKDVVDPFREGSTASLLGKAGTIATQTGIQQAPIMARLNEQALRDYEAQLREQGIMDSSERRNKIFGYFANAGYDADEVNAFLDKYGYADGGRVGIETLYRGPMTAATRRVVDRIEGAVPNEDDENYEDEDDGFKIYPKGTYSDADLNLDAFKMRGGDEDEDEEKLAKALRRSNYDLGEGIAQASKGLEMAFGRPIDMRPERTRFGLAEGGIPNVMAMRKTIAELIASGVIDEEDVEEAVAQIRNQAMMSMRAPGMAEGGMMNLGGREMDMRGGGFIPIGAKERADDVPARLSKNEFVMTADAVRAAGGGSINKGAKRMYDLMNKLESKV